MKFPLFIGLVSLVFSVNANYFLLTEKHSDQQTIQNLIDENNFQLGINQNQIEINDNLKKSIDNLIKTQKSQLVINDKILGTHYAN